MAKGWREVAAKHPRKMASAAGALTARSGSGAWGAAAGLRTSSPVLSPVGLARPTAGAAAPGGDLNVEYTRRSGWGIGLLDRYETAAQIGEGTYGKVFRGRDKLTGAQVALKKMNKRHDTEGVRGARCRGCFKLSNTPLYGQQHTPKSTLTILHQPARLALTSCSASAFAVSTHRDSRDQDASRAAASHHGAAH